MNATTSAPTRQVKRRPKAQRLVRLLITPEGKAPGVVRLTVGETAVDYFLTAIPADFGKGFVVEKIGLDCPQGKYHVNIDGD
ncbi:MAG TPA: hypothetical protein VFA26_22725, partial [Gemmataceae bacterium]|nr:hypothetical protein [Gemmataceae bacterium]